MDLLQPMEKMEVLVKDCQESQGRAKQKGLEKNIQLSRPSVEPNC